jgi:hypothetical protein
MNRNKVVKNPPIAKIDSKVSSQTVFRIQEQLKDGQITI